MDRVSVRVPENQRSFRVRVKLLQNTGKLVTVTSLRQTKPWLTSGKASHAPLKFQINFKSLINLSLFNVYDISYSYINVYDMGHIIWTILCLELTLKFWNFYDR